VDKGSKGSMTFRSWNQTLSGSNICTYSWCDFSRCVINVTFLPFMLVSVRRDR